MFMLMKLLKELIWDQVSMEDNHSIKGIKIRIKCKKVILFKDKQLKDTIIVKINTNLLTVKALMEDVSLILKKIKKKELEP